MAEKPEPPVITSQPLNNPEALASDNELHELIKPQAADMSQQDPNKLLEQEEAQKKAREDCCDGEDFSNCLDLCLEAIRCTVLHNCFSVPWCNNGCCDDGCCHPGCCGDCCCDGECCTGCCEACCDEGCANCLEACFSCGVCVDV